MSIYLSIYVFIYLSIICTHTYTYICICMSPPAFSEYASVLFIGMFLCAHCVDLSCNHTNHNRSPIYRRSMTRPTLSFLSFFFFSLVTFLFIGVRNITPMRNSSTTKDQGRTKSPFRSQCWTTRRSKLNCRLMIEPVAKTPVTIRCIECNSARTRATKTCGGGHIPSR